VQAVSEDVSLTIAVVHCLWAHRGLMLSLRLASKMVDTAADADSRVTATMAMTSTLPEQTSVADVGRRRIQRVTTCGVAGLALAGFAMSYEALHALARDSGVSSGLAWLWPLIVDGFIVVASLSVVRAVIESRRTWHPWALLLLFSSISVAGNIAHGPPTAMGRLVAAVPPVALVLAFDLLMRQVQLTLRPPPAAVPGGGAPCVQGAVEAPDDPSLGRRLPAQQQPWDISGRSRAARLVANARGPGNRSPEDGSPSSCPCRMDTRAGSYAKLTRGPSNPQLMPYECRGDRRDC
jgi:hypothetical protein